MLSLFIKLLLGIQKGALFVIKRIFFIFLESKVYTKISPIKSHTSRLKAAVEFQTEFKPLKAAFIVSACITRIYSFKWQLF